MHTPTPWHIRPDYGKENVYRLWNADDNYPDDTSPEVMDDNAEFMMQAVNAHEAIKNALELILDDYTHGTWCPESDELIPTIRRALALADGKEQP